MKESKGKEKQRHSRILITRERIRSARKDELMIFGLRESVNMKKKEYLKEKFK